MQTPEVHHVPIHSFTSSPQPVQSSQPGDMAQTPLKGTMQTSKNLFLTLAVVVVIAGLVTGVGVGKLRAAAQSTANGITPGQAIQQVAGSNIKNGDVFGSANATDFKDSADGYLVTGGIDGEGSDHLLRPGGVSQTVYLTSSVTDLSKFEGMEIKVWGETFQGQKAGWLMDVGRVQVINTQAQAPAEK